MTDPAFLRPARFIESGDPAIVAFARQAADGAAGQRDAAIALYNAVRDGIIYDPYQNFARPAAYSASHTLATGRGFCVAKAALLAACARAQGIPARLGFADVKNHLSTPRLLERNGGPVFFWHAYADLLLEDRWVKATPAFNLAMCERFHVKPLDFDGRGDSVFHPYDARNRRHMEYVLDRGTYPDVPFESIIATFRANCPGMLEEDSFRGGDFTAESKG